MQRISQHLNPFTCCGSCCCARPFFPCAADHRRPCADHALYFCAVTSLPGGKGCSGVFWAKRGRFWTDSPRSQKRTFLGGQRPTCIFPVAGCVAKRLNPATGRDRAAGQSPVGLTFRYKAARPMPPTMLRPCAYVLCWALPFKGRRICGLV